MTTLTTRRRWQEMPGWQQTGITVLAATEIVLTTLAAVDLVRRDKSAVRGRKLLWWPVLTVQPLGPVAYLKWGRKR
jgi:hypothetical protein